MAYHFVVVGSEMELVDERGNAKSVKPWPWNKHLLSHAAKLLGDGGYTFRLTGTLYVYRREPSVLELYHVVD